MSQLSSLVLFAALVHLLFSRCCLGFQLQQLSASSLLVPNTATTRRSLPQIPIPEPRHPPSRPYSISSSNQPSSTALSAANDGTPATEASSTTSTRSLSLSLSKPLGLILEEVVENQPRGVYVMDVATDAGSAAPYRDQILGCPISSVDGNDVTSLRFDDVMDLLVNAPSPVQVEFLVASDTGKDAEPPSESTELPVGAPVTLRVRTTPNNGDYRSLPGKVGDNLRQTLLDHNVEVYQGLKQKLGNCGGAGQCGFCAMDFLESDGWLERSDYEDQKLKKYPAARLACLNSIQGPATMQKTQQ